MSSVRASRTGTDPASAPPPEALLPDPNASTHPYRLALARRPREATRRLMAAIAALEADLRTEAVDTRRRLHPRLRLDVSFADLLFAAGACFGARRVGRENDLLRTWGDSNGVVCLSLRSAFDLLLEALRRRAGDEIAF